MPNKHFFKLAGDSVDARMAIPLCLQNESALRNVLQRLQVYTQGHYLQAHFCHWLSAYVKQANPFLKNYFIGKVGLNFICQDFIQFCFRQKISLDKDKTLQSFASHDAISDNAIKREIANIKPKNTMNLLGFGLGNGYYEKSIAKYLIEHEKAKTVKIYGIDPYPEKTADITFIKKEELATNNIPKFDLIIARWALHHVELKYRWLDFVNCINNTHPDAHILIIEHGFLQNHFSKNNKRLYYLLNATFDIIANIGIRPHWFIDTIPIGKNFFIHYLQPQDFAAIKNTAIIPITQNIYEVGPGFPNQTICSMRIIN